MKLTFTVEDHLIHEPLPLTGELVRCELVLGDGLGSQPPFNGCLRTGTPLIDGHRRWIVPVRKLLQTLDDVQVSASPA